MADRFNYKASNNSNHDKNKKSTVKKLETKKVKPLSEGPIDRVLEKLDSPENKKWYKDIIDWGVT